MVDEVTQRQGQGPSAILRTGRLLAALVTVLGFAFVLPACGGEEKPNKCREVTCGYGVCDPATGQCVNAETCDPTVGMSGMSGDAGMSDAASGESVKESDCLEGYTCQAGTCEVSTAACEADADCDNGVCESGACVNKDSCESNTDCVDGYRCDSAGQCVVNPCADKTCDAGVCEVETGDCVNREVCPSPEGEPPACVDDFKCYGQACVDQQQFCEDIACERGVCDFESLSCVDAETCEEDSECLDGKYCTEEGACEVNQCDAQMKDCPRGVCDRATGDCVNPESCSSPDDCLAMNVCIDGSCVAEGEACGEEGCPGNQVCDYSAPNLSASCVENTEEDCRNAVDCTGDRICQADGTCSDVSADACKADSHEPNNSDSEASDYHTAASGGLVDGNICSGDVDVFKFDTSKDTAIRGQFAIDLTYDTRDVGLGTLEVELIDPDGTSLVTKQAGAQTPGELNIEHPFQAGDGGVYTIKVRGTGDVKTPGVNYEMLADIIDQSVISACQMPTQLMMPKTTGNTRQGGTIAVDASCIPEGPKAAENIYSFTLSDESYVEIDVTPTGQGDVSAALRSKCESLRAEMTCQNDGGEGEGERIAGAYEAGTYFLIVQPPTPNTGGDYEITFNAETIVCSDADNTCVDSSTAKICNGKGTKLAETSCEMGCDMQRGVCNRPAGDACWTAIDATSGLKDSTFKWGDMKNDLDPGAGSCLGQMQGASDGPDTIYEVELKPNWAMKAELATTGGAQASLYLLSKCGSASSTCLEGQDTDKSPETLTYENTSGNTVTLYVVADSAAGTTGEATINIQAGEKTCMPGATQCMGNDVQVCNSLGIAFETSKTCANGCNNGTCTGDTCMAAIDAKNGGMFTINSGQFNNDYSVPNSSCTGDEMPAADAAFLVEANPGDVIQASVTPQDSGDDPAIYMVESCSTMPAQMAQSCVAGDDDDFSGDAEQIAHIHNGNQTKQFYVIVDGDDVSQSGGKWDVNITVQQPSCTPGDSRCANTTTLEYCGEFGLSYKSYTCQGSPASCTASGGSASCGSPTGYVCADAIPVKDGDTKSGKLESAAGNDLEMPENSQTGQCYFGSNDATDGDESFYSINLQKDDILEVSLSTSDRSARMYIMSNCLQQSSCLANTDNDGPGKLSFRAPSAGTYYVVVDSTSSFGTDTYSVSFDVLQNATCAPGTTECVNQNTVGVCDDFGIGYSSQSSCANGCSNGSCSVMQSAVDKCSTAPDIGKGIVVTDSFTGLTNDVNLPSGSCTPTAGDGPDSVYKVQMSAGEVLTARAESLGNDEVVLYALSGCGMSPQNNCKTGNAAGSNGASTSISYEATGPETIYVVVDSDSSNADEAFKAEIAVQPKECSAGQTKCGPQGQVLQYCGENSLFKNYRCKGGCNNGKCAQPQGGICADAINVSAGQTINGSFGGGGDTFRLGGDQVGGCFLDNIDTLEGDDRFYSIGLNKGDTLSAKLTTQESDAQVLILGTCGDPSSCLTNNPEGGETTQTYTATSPQRVFIVVDSLSSSTESYTLDIDVTQGNACSPGDSVCVGSNSVGLCNDDGSAFVGQYSCAQGCSAGACQATASADKCSTAPTISSGTVVYHDYDNLTNDVDLKSSTACTGTSGSGGDAVYAIQLNKDQIIQLEAVSWGGESPLVYVVDDCAKPNNTCRAAGSTGGGRSSTYFRAPSAGIYYVVLDGSYGGMDEPVEFRVKTVPPECQKGQIQCGSQGKDLQYCNEFLQYDSYTCDGGCANGKCKKPTGDICIDAIAAQPGNTYSGNYSNLSNSFEPSGSSCGLISSSADYDGPDAVYSVNLTKGQILSAKLTTQQTDPGMYILDSCPNDNNVNNCAWGAYDSKELQFYADTTKTYYLVVDTGSTFLPDPYTLDLSVRSGGVCQPGSGSCSQGTLTVCNDQGTAQTGTYSCTNGCSGGYCNRPSMGTADTCMNPHKISGGTYMVDSWGNYSADINLANQMNSCGISDTDGREAVYAIDVPAGEYVEARVEPNGTDDPSLYFIEDCSKPNTCLVSAESTDAPAQLGWLNDSSSKKTVLLVADTDSTNDQNNFLLQVNTTAKECTPNSMNPPTRCADADTSEVCTSYGKYEPKNCYFGCDNNTGACKPPPNDKCSGAIALQGGQTYKAEISEYSGDYDAKPQSGGSCTGGSSDSPGPDAVYKVQLNKGDFVDLTYQSPDDASLWITTDCSNAASSCVAGADDNFSSPESLTFVAQKADTYYVIADVDDTGQVSGEFSLTVNHAGPPNCQVGQGGCSNDGVTLNYCESPGQTKQYTCPTACGSGTCQNKTGDICAIAQDASSGGKFTVDYSTLKNNYDLPSSGCAGDDMPAPDAAFRINASPGDVINAKVTPQSSGDDPAVYLVEGNCTSNPSIMNQFCVAGDDSDFSGSAESIQYVYTGSQPKTFYVVVDGDDTSQANGKVDLDVSVKQPICQPGTTTCKNPTTLQYCDGLGINQVDYTCAGSGSTTCQNGACTNPTGDICPDAISVPQGGGMFTADYSTLSNHIQMPSGTCTNDRTEGKDAIYRVSANAGQKITVTATPQSTGDDAVVYILKDCLQVQTDPNTACVGGADKNFTGSSNSETFDYTVPAGQGGTYYVVLDADDSGQDTGKVDMNITVQ